MRAKRIFGCGAAMAIVMACGVPVMGQQKPAQAPEKAPAISPALQKMMEEHRKAIQPGQEHLNLMRLEGNYVTKEKFYLPGATVPKESDGTATLRAEMQGRFIVEHNHGGYLGEPYSGLRIYGFNNGTKKYEGAWVYTGSTSIMSLVGDSKDGGKTIEYTATFHDDATGKLQTMAVTLRMLDPDHFEVELKSTMPDGSPGPRLVSLYTRKLLPGGS
jgi:Protein of unknown function (DUF1579)